MSCHPHLPLRLCGFARVNLHAPALLTADDDASNPFIPHLKALKDRPNATPRQKVMSEIMSSVDRTRVDTQRNEDSAPESFV